MQLVDGDDRLGVETGGLLDGLSSPRSPAPAMNAATSTRVTSAAFAYDGCSEKPVHDAATVAACGTGSS